MSNPNFVNYQVALVPENAELINQLNELLITGSTATPKSATTAKEPSKTTSKPAAQTSSAQGAAPAVSLDDVKNAAKAAKKDHGEDWVMATLKEQGVEVATTLGRSMSKIAEDQYATMVDVWAAGPQASDEPEDDGFGDDEDDGLGDDTPEVSAEAVQTALKAYSKDVGRAEAKAVMNKHGAKALSNVPECSPEQLAAMMAELV